MFLSDAQDHKDKYQLALKYIGGLSSSHQCKSWSVGITSCHCIDEKVILMDAVKVFSKKKSMFSGKLRTIMHPVKMQKR